MQDPHATLTRYLHYLGIAFLCSVTMVIVACAIWLTHYILSNVVSESELQCVQRQYDACIMTSTTLVSKTDAKALKDTILTCTNTSRSICGPTYQTYVTDVTEPKEK